jgi:hypothetical protein
MFTDCSTIPVDDHDLGKGAVAFTLGPAGQQFARVVPDVNDRCDYVVVVEEEENREKKSENDTKF